MGLNESESDTYCQCGACGESGCCSPFMCLSKLISESSSCKFGKGYLEELMLAWNFSEWILSEITEKHVLDEKTINQKYRELLDEMFERRKK